MSSKLQLPFLFLRGKPLTLDIETIFSEFVDLQLLFFNSIYIFTYVYFYLDWPTELPSGVRGRTASWTTAEWCR